MDQIDFVFDAPNPKLTNPFSEIFHKNLPRVKALEIAVGYVSERSLDYLQEIVNTNSLLELTLVCGMQGVDGMTPSQLCQAKILDQTLRDSGRGGVFVPRNIPYHGKIYIFKMQAETSCYIGSANLSSISKGGSRTFESGLYLRKCPSAVIEHLERDLYPNLESLSNANIRLIEDRDSPMKNVTEAEPVSTSEVAEIMRSAVDYTFHIPLKVTPKSSLNAHLSGDGKRKQRVGVGLERNWYEGELIVDKKYRDRPGYPAKGAVFTVVTDNGWTFDCKTSGAGGKNLRSAGKLSTFGTWIKSRFVEAGVVKYGDPIQSEHLKAYGRTYLTMRHHPEFNKWSFDLSVTSRTSLEIPQTSI